MSAKVRLADQVADLCSGEGSENVLYERAVDLIFEGAEHFNWVGIYKVEGSDLVLAAWRGPQPTEHTRIAMDRGICGLAATDGKTVVVDDVDADPRYLACFASTKSEVVVPILADGRVVAEIDIDSDSSGAFTPEDRAILEEVAGILGRRIGEIRS